MRAERSADVSLVPEHVAFRLGNGARGLLVPRPHSPTFAFQLVVRAGSRHDGPHPGLAHLVEHLAFRAPGGERPDLFAAVESLGGDVGASTRRDYTTFEVVVAAHHAERALALLPALARPPDAAAATVQGEQRVICQELREHTRPADALWDLLLTALWGGHPLAYPPGGTAAGVQALDAAAAAAFQARNYTPSRLLVVGAGACAPEAFQVACRDGLGARADPAPRAAEAVAPALQAGRLESPGPGPGTYLAVGAAVPGADHAATPALRLLAVILGHGPGSRLSRALAARGLHAAAQARYAAYADVGVFAVLAAGPSAGDPLAEVVEHEVRRLASAPPTAVEVRAAQRRYAGAVYRRCESNAGLVGALAEAAVGGDLEPPLERTLARALRLTPGAVRTAAQQHLAPTLFARATLRPAD